MKYVIIALNVTSTSVLSLNVLLAKAPADEFPGREKSARQLHLQRCKKGLALLSNWINCICFSVGPAHFTPEHKGCKDAAEAK